VAVRNLKNAWNTKLGKVDVRAASILTAREIYTGLYTLYANIIDVTDNGSGYTPVSPSTRLLTIGSSVWWERVGRRRSETAPSTARTTPGAGAYLKTWNSVGRIFQARNTDGSWAPVNAGLFEGNTTAYAFEERVLMLHGLPAGTVLVRFR
jgi:hypothetical protein